MTYWWEYASDRGHVKYTWVTSKFGAPIDRDNLAVKIDGDTYTLVDYQASIAFVAGPFDTLDAAKAAYLLIGAST